MNHHRRAILRALLAAGASPLVRAADIAAPGRLIYGFGMTPVTDTLLPPILAQLQGRYQPSLGTRLVTVPGNAGLNALRSVVQAPPDGATALLLPSTVITLASTKADDPLEQIAPVAAVSEFSLGFAVGPSVPPSVTNMASYLDWVQQNPTQAHYGVVGLGAGQHFIGSEIAGQSRVRLRAESYKSGTAQLDDLRNGRLPAAVAIVYTASDALSQPSVRLLAHSGNRPLPGMPSIPTLVSLGLMTSPVVESFGVFVSRRVATGKISELGDAIDQMLMADAIRSTLASVRMYPPATNSTTYAASLVAERSDWTVRVAQRGFSAES